MLIIQNISGGFVEISDLGFGLNPSEMINLSLGSEPQEVASSASTGGDLENAITNGTIIVKDPRDGITNLSVADSKLASKSHNDTHYSMPVGARIADAVDVDLSSPGSFLRFDGSTFVRQTPAELAGEVETNIDFNNIQGGHNAWEIVDGDGDTHIRVQSAENTDEDTAVVTLNGTATTTFASGSTTHTTDLILTSGADLLAGAGSTIFAHVDGTATNPAFSFGNDADTGIYQNANNLLGITAGGLPAALFGFSDTTLNNSITFGEYTNVRDDGPTSKALYVDLNGELMYGDIALAASNIAGVQVSRTTTLTITTSFQDINFDVTDLETQPDTLEHDLVTGDRILIKEDGLYRMSTIIPVDFPAGVQTVTVDVIKNDLTVVSMAIQEEDDETNNIASSPLVELSAGDFISVRIKSTGTGAVVLAGAVFNINKLSGVRGEKGADGQDGAGSNVIVQDTNVTVTGGPHGTLNFEGFDVSDEGTGKVTITNTSLAADMAVVIRSRTGASQTLSPSTQTEILYDTTELQNDTDVIAVGTNPARIVAKETGMYLYIMEGEYSIATANTTATLAITAAINGVAVGGETTHRVQLFKDGSVDGMEAVRAYHAIPILLTAGDEISTLVTSTLFIGTGAVSTNGFPTHTLIRLSGAKGDKGDAGTSFAVGGKTFQVNSWTLLSGTIYYHDVIHNLDTESVTWSLYDTVTKLELYPEYVQVLGPNSLRVAVEGNIEDITINIVSGSGPEGPRGLTGAGSDVAIESEGTPLTTAVNKINFIGATVTTTESATDQILVNVSGISDVVQDTTPQLGGNLDMQGNSILANGFTVSPVVLSRIAGVTSNVQTQINNKISSVQDDTTPTLGGVLDVATFGLLANGLSLSPNELGYLDGVTSNIQAQLNAKPSATGHTHIFRLPHTWAISGQVKVAAGQTDFILPMFISLAPGQTAVIAQCRHRINAGTSVTAKLQKNGVDVTGFTGMNITTTSATTNPANVAVASDDRLSLVVTAVSGTPQNMSFTMFIEYTQ